VPGAVETPNPDRDVRLGGAWTPAQRLKNDALWLSARAALAAARMLPPFALAAGGRALGGLAFGAFGRARRLALANVARVHPDWSASDRTALVRRAFVTLGEHVGEIARALAGQRDCGPPLPLASDARAALREAESQGRGVVFASAHLGPWERVAASLVAGGVPLVAVARESYDPRFSALFARSRARAGVRVIWRAERGAAFRIVRTLRHGEVLGIPMDLRARVESRLVPFLGHLAPTAIGPARIALRTGAAVVVGTSAPRAGGGLEVTATPIATRDLHDDDAGTYELTRRINSELSRRILALPHAWVWMHDRWASA